VSDVTTPQAAPDAAAGRDEHATTPLGVTSRYATVREAADELGVSTETIRRMIRAGRLRAERVHRPQGTAFLVELPAATGQATQDATDATALGRHNATPEPVLSPALLAAEAWARGVVGPLTETIAEQQRQLISQAETIGALRAELDALRAQHGTPEPSGSTERPALPTEPSAPWWRRRLSAWWDAVGGW
jgi:excisionase family DNA binding protein